MSKNLRYTVAWILFASLITSLAYWQAQVAVAKDQTARQATLPPPPKTRHSIRPLAQTSSGDPITSFNARLAKGLTDREVAWIIEDFKTAGLDLGVRAASSEEYLSQRQAQDRWYRDALVEGWSLSRDQSGQINARLGELYDRAKTAFLETLADGPKPFEHDGKWFTITSAEPIRRLIDANLRFQDSSSPYMPWNLGEFIVKSPKSRPSNTETTDTNGKSLSEAASLEENHASPTDPNLLVVDSLLPRNSPSLSASSGSVALQENEILSSIRKLHPSQFKLLLLINPAKANEIEAALGVIR